MSGKPYPEGVDKAIDLMDKAALLGEEIRALAPVAKRLQEAQLESQAIQIEIQTHLRSMDLGGVGNAGWETRLSWFLQEMRRRVTP